MLQRQELPDAFMIQYVVRDRPCVGCMHIPERNCQDFNNDLSRRSVESLNIEPVNGEETKFGVGYWD